MDLKPFYRKYRPQNLSQLDLATIRQGLTDLVRSKRVPPALLFAGPKGTGKTSAARVLAKALNCQKKKNYEPCNQCEVCRSITAGSAMDLIEIDAASNRGIDDIRDLKEKISLAPVRCRYKVYIIDEVHMLTKEAFNALLKTLEEPPRHAIFILCTTEPEKLPATIVSRCLRFNFGKASTKEMMGSLQKVVDGEKLEVEEGVLATIAQAADGSFRDGQKMLEQLSMAGAKISLSAAQKLVGQIESLNPKKLLALIAERKTQKALLELDRVVAAGADLVYFSHQLLDQLRLALLVKVGVQKEAGLEKLNLPEVKKLISLFSQAYREIKFSPIPQLPLEMAIVEFGASASSDGDKNVRGHGKRSDSPVSGRSPLPERCKGESKVNGHLVELQSKWQDILEQVKPLNHSVQALLRACRPLAFDGRELKLEVFYKFHKERLETEKCRRIVEQVTGEIFQTPIRLVCVLGQKERSNSPASGDAEGGDSSGVLPSDDILATAANIFK